MRQPLSLALLVMLLTATVAGCSRWYFDWNTRSFRQPPEQIARPAAPVAVPSPVNAAPRPQTAAIHKRKHKRPPSTPDMKEMSIQPETTQTSPMPPPTSTISMVSPGGNSDAVEKQIEAAGQRLAHFDRNQLSGPTLATYDQANGFLSQGKQALEEKDYVAASGFAQKASVLTDRLQATVTAR